MGFFRDGISMVVFPFVYIMILTETISVYFIWDGDKDSWLFYTKLLYLFNTIMSIWSHIMATITDPGSITHHNNVHVLEIYINIRSHCVKNADNFNAKFRSVLLKMKDEELQESDSDLDNSDYGYSYDIHSDIRDNAIEEISKEYRIKLSRCKRCLVVRPPRSHHCTRCKKCFLKKDHHCPWINNCIGAFNQKHFILFNYYSLNGIFLSIYMLLYYLMYKHKQIYMKSNWLIGFSVVHLIFSLIFLVFSFIMVKDQISAIRNETALIDPKRKIFIEARDIDECWNEAFGEPFHIFWFFPMNRNWIRNSYIKGRIDEPEEEKKEADKQGVKDKKEKEKDINDESSFEDMLKAAVANMKKETAKKEEENIKNLGDEKPVKSDPRKNEDAPSNSQSYEQMLKKAREDLFGNNNIQNNSSNNNQSEEKMKENRPISLDEIPKEIEKPKEITYNNQDLGNVINKAIGGYEEYLNTIVDNNNNDDDDSEEDIVQKEKEVHEADELLGKLNDFMNSMKSKIEENKKKASEKKIEAKKRKEEKKKMKNAESIQKMDYLINETNEKVSNNSSTIRTEKPNDKKLD